MNSKLVGVTLTLLTALESPADAQFHYGGPTVPGEPRVDEGLNDDGVVGQVLNAARTFIGTHSAASAWDREKLRQKDRITLAVRAAASRGLSGVRKDLLAIVEVCEGKFWQEMALDTYAAIHSIEESRTYLMGQVALAPEHPYRAAAAMWILAGRVDAEVDQVLRTTIENCRGLKNGLVAVQALQDIAFHVTYARTVKAKVTLLATNKERLAADKILIRETWMAFPSKNPVSPPSGWTLYRPSSMFSKRLLQVRMKQDRLAVISALSAMNWRDFSLDPESLPEPENAEALAKGMREQFRQAYPALAL